MPSPWIIRTGEPSRRPHALYAMFVPSSVTVADMTRGYRDLSGGEQSPDRPPHRLGEARRRERVVRIVGIRQRDHRSEGDLPRADDAAEAAYRPPGGGNDRREGERARDRDRRVAGAGAQPGGCQRDTDEVAGTQRGRDIRTAARDRTEAARRGADKWQVGGSDDPQPATARPLYRDAERRGLR